MTKFDVINEKPSKTGILGQNGHLLTVFGQKTAKIDFFFKNPLGTFFYIAKALTNCKVSEKTNERILRKRATHVHTYIRTYIQGST